MPQIFSKLFNHWTLLTINILIVVVVEATGSYFANSGLIHLIALFFIALGLIRAASHTHVYDQFLEPVIHRGILALIVMAVSHVLEYVTFMRLMFPRETVASNVVNFYLISLIIITLGVESFMVRLDKKSKTIVPLLRIAIVPFPILILLSFVNQTWVHLSPESWQLYAYLIAVVFVGGLSIWRLQALRRVPIMVNFLEYFTAAFILIGLSALFSTLEVVITSFGIAYVQVVYLNHFLFYGALSFIFLAYDRLLHLGGIYEELNAMKDQMK